VIAVSAYVVIYYLYFNNAASPRSSKSSNINWSSENIFPPPMPPTAFAELPIKIGKNVVNFVYQLYQPIKGGNSASILTQGCKNKKNHSNSTKIELVTGFVDLSHPYYRKMLGDLRYISDRPANSTIHARHMEVINVLQVNLLHSMIENVHVVVWSQQIASYLKSLYLRNSEKLIVRVTGKDVGLKEQLEYASECLKGKVVAITNQDNTIGKGWDNKDYIRILKENKIMYGLTRHSTATEIPTHGSNCTWTKSPYNNCDAGGIYWGSHDTFILQVRKWTSNELDGLTNVTPDKPGMENVFLWYLQTKMGYTVLNPCQVLFVHHHHCIPIRGRNRQRINVGGKSAVAGFTDKFE